MLSKILCTARIETLPWLKLRNRQILSCSEHDDVLSLQILNLALPSTEVFLLRFLLFIDKGEGWGREDSFNLCLFGVDMIKFIVCYRDWWIVASNWGHADMRVSHVMVAVSENCWLLPCSAIAVAEGFVNAGEIRLLVCLVVVVIGTCIQGKCMKRISDLCVQKYYRFHCGSNIDLWATKNYGGSSFPGIQDVMTLALQATSIWCKVQHCKEV